MVFGFTYILPDLRMDNGSVNDCAGPLSWGMWNWTPILMAFSKAGSRSNCIPLLTASALSDLDQRRCYIDGTSHPIVAFLISVETETVYISYLEVTVVDPFRQFDNATVFLGVLHAKVPAFFAAQIIGIRAFWSAVIIINRNKTGVFIFIGGDFLRAW